METNLQSTSGEPLTPSVDTRLEHEVSVPENLDEAVDVLASFCADPSAEVEYVEAVMDDFTADVSETTTINTPEHEKLSSKQRPPLQEASQQHPLARKSERRTKGKRKSYKSEKSESTAPTKRSEQSPLKRRRSSVASLSRQSQHQKRVPCLDVREDRLVQPLIETPKQGCTAADIVALTDIWHPLPDTFTLAYSARLLGFNVAPTVSNANKETVPFNSQTLPLLRDDSYLQIPPLGSFATSVWQSNRFESRSCHDSPDLADQQTLDVLDPIYEALISAGDNDFVTGEDTQKDCMGFTQPVTKTHVTKLWGLLVEACVSAENSGEKEAKQSLWTKTLKETERVSNLCFRVHAYRSLKEVDAKNSQSENDDAADLRLFPDIDLTGLDIPADTILALIVSLNGRACGALCFCFDWFVTTARTALVIRWEHLLLTTEENAELVSVLLIALSMEYARATQAFYGTYDYNPWRTSVPFLRVFEECFRVLRLAIPLDEHEHPSCTPEGATGTDEEGNKQVADARGSQASLVVHAEIYAEGSSINSVHPRDPKQLELASAVIAPGKKTRIVADLNKSSSRYALLTWKRLMEEKRVGVLSNNSTPTAEPTKYRALVRLPNIEEATCLMEGQVYKTKKLPGGNQALSVFASAGIAQSNVTVHIQAKPKDDNTVEIFSLSNEGDPLTIDIPEFKHETTGWQMLKAFPLSDKTSPYEDELSDLLREMNQKQAQLAALEKGMEPHLRELMERVVQERLEYERIDHVAMKHEEARLLKENKKLIDERRAMDVEKQKRLEQDMDAVCCICNDGEVTPDNQIIFCESCDVPVHQLCYGVEQIPSEDYYCLACKHLGRDKEPKTSKRKPLLPPIVCSLCPHRGGALIRSSVPLATKDGGSIERWVHAVCAKWQGLVFVNSTKHDLIEDFTELKDSFRRLKIRCSLCRGDRGCMNKCRKAGCNNWLHILCARTSRLCEVNHGENCHGEIPEDPWTLLCPSHSKTDTLPKDAIPLPRLVEMAKEFPPEPEPEKRTVVPIPFNNANGDERRLLLSDAKYEQALIFELLVKRHAGIRCEICDSLTESSKDIVRCGSCAASFCFGCKVEGDEVNGGVYKCRSCVFRESKKPAETPACIACFQKGGPLSPAVATPIKKSSWAHRRKEFERSIFNRTFWVHTMCAFWHERLFFIKDPAGCVDFRDVVTPHSKFGFVADKYRCEVCGQRGGLKMTCCHPGCVVKHDGESSEAFFHPTCARQAGLEVTEDEKRCYLKCYRHSGNEYNLRAHLEDLIEIEKRRAGKNFARVDNPMTFSDACRILHASIRVMRVLGWAWRWAEWWVDYNSSWEPLLEPGEKEEDMTKEELKIVDSTRESRASDARKCRLAAFGAALRNRAYDVEDDFDRDALDKAIRSILITKTLVGPMENYEIDFLADWLARAYKTRSRLLGYGEYRIEVAREAFCLHIQDGSPKFELLDRPIPGRNTSFVHKVESGILEPDDFLKAEILEDINLPSGPAEQSTKRPRGGKETKSRNSTTPLRRTTAQKNRKADVSRTVEVYRRSDGRFARLTDGEDLKRFRIAKPGFAGCVLNEKRSPRSSDVARKKPQSSEVDGVASDKDDRNSKGLGKPRIPGQSSKRRGRGRPPKATALRRQSLSEDASLGSDSSASARRQVGTGRGLGASTSEPQSDGISLGTEFSNDESFARPRPTISRSGRKIKVRRMAFSSENGFEDSVSRRGNRSSVEGVRDSKSKVRVECPTRDEESKSEQQQLRRKKRGRPPKQSRQVDHSSQTGDEPVDELGLMDWKIPSKKTSENDRVDEKLGKQMDRLFSGDAVETEQKVRSLRTKPSSTNREAIELRRRSNLTTPFKSGKEISNQIGFEEASRYDSSVRVSCKRRKRGRIQCADGDNDGTHNTDEEDSLPIDTMVALARTIGRNVLEEHETKAVDAEKGSQQGKFVDPKLRFQGEKAENGNEDGPAVHPISPRKRGRQEGKEEAARLFR